MIRVLIVDDQKTSRELLKTYLEPEPDFTVVGTAIDGRDALSQIEVHQPDVVIMDVEMPGMDGLTATRLIAQRHPGIKVVILTSHEDDDYLNRALQVGANGYLLKNTPSSEIGHHIRLVIQGHFQLGPGLLERVLFKVSESMVSSDDITLLRELIQERTLPLDPPTPPPPPPPSYEEDIKRALNETIRVAEQQRYIRVQMNTLETRLARLERKVSDSYGLVVLIFILGGLAALGFILSPW